MLIVRELLLGPRRFNQLLEGLPGISTNLLAERLKFMRTQGLLLKERGTYRLDRRGRELESVIIELGRWGWKEMARGPGPADATNIGWALVALKRRYQGGMRCVFELSSSGRTFELNLTPKELLVNERRAAAPEFTLQVELSGFARVFYGGESWHGLIEVSGDVEAWERVYTHFKGVQS